MHGPQFGSGVGSQAWSLPTYSNTSTKGQDIRRLHRDEGDSAEGKGFLILRHLEKLRQATRSLQAKVTLGIESKVTFQGYGAIISRDGD